MAITFMSPLWWDAFPTSSYHACACEPACACPGEQQQQQQGQNKKQKKQHGKEKACAAGACARPLDRDAVETNDAYELVLDVPGFGPDALAIEVEDGLLSVSSNKRKDNNDKPATDAAGDEAHVLLRERRNRRVSRSYVLPKDAAADDITASVEHGVLRVHVPKVAPMKPATRRIVVNATEQPAEVAAAE